ncbi:MAG: fused MFS/spermidine synthase [Chloroflexota bacterium]|nr:fused MFS/spermidine synthase [Chloroflexota bacterium]MDE2946336.1 fused MFS/spermidine synthase [Chloroflexota bacterium]
MSAESAASQTRLLSKASLYLIAFVSGMTTLAIELSASRLLGSVFGNSNLVWANVIGLMLLYLTAGYFLGGRLADRFPREDLLLKLILWAAFLCALIPLVARPIISRAAQAVFGAEAALALGSFIVILILFSVPVTLLGAVSPFIIRLAVTDVAGSGKVAGQVYAISTLGSLLGTFLPVLVTIPHWGTTRTFLMFSGALFVIAFAAHFRIDRRGALPYVLMPLALVLIMLAAPNGPLRPAAPGASLMYEGESAYNYIQVQEDAAGYRYLYLNEGQGVHSQWHAQEVFFGGTWDYFLVAPYFNETPFRADQVTSMLLIGLAAGAIPRQYAAVYGDIPIDGIELDPEIVAVGAKYFDMNAEAMPNLSAHVGDGRYLLRRLDEDYTVIGIDAYRPPYIPWHLTTVEFFSEVKERLAERGVVAINVGRTDTDRRLVDALSNTLLQVFPSVHAIDVPSSFNTILVATDQATSAGNLRRNLNYPVDSVNPVLYDVLESAAENIVPLGESDIIFTDDRAPVESLVDSIVLRFLLAGRAEEFRLDDG